jgi:hypothetical protein
LRGDKSRRPRGEGERRRGEMRRLPRSLLCESKRQDAEGGVLAHYIEVNQGVQAMSTHDVMIIHTSIFNRSSRPMRLLCISWYASSASRRSSYSTNAKSRLEVDLGAGISQRTRRPKLYSRSRQCMVALESDCRDRGGGASHCGIVYCFAASKGHVHRRIIKPTCCDNDPVDAATR